MLGKQRDLRHVTNHSSPSSVLRKIEPFGSNLTVVYNHANFQSIAFASSLRCSSTFTTPRRMMADLNAHHLHVPTKMLNKAVSGNKPGNSSSPSLSPISAHSCEGSLPWEKEKCAEGNDEPESEKGWPIQYHYLTFETDLPHPTSITPTTADATL